MPFGQRLVAAEASSLRPGDGAPPVPRAGSPGSPGPSEPSAASPSVPRCGSRRRSSKADLGTALAEAAACLGLDVSGRARLETATIAGRPALVLAVELDMSSEADLHAVWQRWMAMLRCVRITGPDRPGAAQAAGG